MYRIGAMECTMGLTTRVRSSYRLIAYRLASIDYNRTCPLQSQGLSGELNPTEADARVAILCNCRKNYHLDRRSQRQLIVH